MRVSQWSHQSCDRKSAPDFGWVWLRCGGAGGGLSIASIHLTQLAGPGLSLLSLRFTRPAVLFASIFFISLHVAFRAPASSIKGRMLSVRLPLARGPRGRQTRVGRSAPLCWSLLIPPKSHRVRRHRRPVFGPCKIRGTKTHAECAPPMSTAFAHNAGIVIATRVPFGAFSCLAFAGWHGCVCQSVHAQNTKTWA